MLRVRNLSKRFGGTAALDAVDLDIGAGEIHALVGHNGSGKSTLIKILAGYHQADHGEVTLNGKLLGHHQRSASERDQLRFVHQDLGLVLELSALENLSLRGGFATSRTGRIDWAAQRRQTVDLLERFDVQMDVDLPLARCTPVERTIVAIVGALQGWRGGAGVLVLDEPTAVLPPSEVARLFALVRQVRDTGTSVLYVSHRLDEIFALCDSVTVLRGGKRIHSGRVAGLSMSELVTLLVGDEQRSAAPRSAPSGPVVLGVKGLHGPNIRAVSFELQRGEILGLAGRKGSGFDEIPYALARALPRKLYGGHIRFGDSGQPWRDVRDHPPGTVALVPAERAREGVVAEFGVKENLTLSLLPRLRRRATRSVDRRDEDAVAMGWIDRLGIRCSGPDAGIGTLSGGNQQKVLVGRCLALAPDILLLCEPTAGVDIGTRNALYELIRAQAGAGLSVIVSSTDMSELVQLCDRVLLLARGVVELELAGPDVVESNLIQAIERTPSHA